MGRSESGGGEEVRRVRTLKSLIGNAPSEDAPSTFLERLKKERERVHRELVEYRENSYTTKGRKRIPKKEGLTVKEVRAKIAEEFGEERADEILKLVLAQAKAK